VVSIGKAITDLIADPNGPAAFDYSVEFCGGTHLGNSSHIERFIILSEEAIAKGIRRIIAVTGVEAQKAQKRADTLEQHVQELVKKINAQIQDSNKNNVNIVTLNKEILSLNEQLNQSQISYWRKDKFRQDLETIRKSLIELEKANKAQLLTQSLEDCKQFVAENPNAERVVKEFRLGGEAKSLNEVLKYLRSQLPNALIMLFSIDDLNSKILCLSSVPDSKKNLIKANEWINEISGTMGAKGGGKDTQAQATGTNVSSLNDCINLAEKFAEIKLSS
jgi:alanyl-tRNA synthetase